MATANAMRKLQKIAKLKQAMLDAVRHGAIMYANGKGGRPIVDQHFTAGNQQRYGWPPLSRPYFLWKQGLLSSSTPAMTKKARRAIRAVVVNRKGLRSALMRHAKRLHKAGDLQAGQKLAREINAFDAQTKQAVAEITKKVTATRKPRVVPAKNVKLDKNAGFRSKLSGGLVGEGTGKNLPMLVLTGEMRKTVNSKQHSIRVTGGNASILFKNLVEYAKYHHEGSGRLPQRSPVLPNAQDRAQVLEHMKAYIRRAVGLQPNKRTI